MKFLPLSLLAFPLVQALPNGYSWGCFKGNVSASLPFCDHTIDLKDRVQDLVSRLTLEEKLNFLGADNATYVNSCNCMSGGIDRLGISGGIDRLGISTYMTNSAVASVCMGDEKCATEFPGPTNMASSFNKTFWRMKGEIVSDEMRAFNNLNGYRTMDPIGTNLIGLIGFELPGEDPLLSGSYAVEYVKGMQEGKKGDPRYFKMISGLKHYAAYSVENARFSRMFNISQFDLFDTYLRQYKMAFSADQGNAQAVMCSYAGINGVPSCANDFILNKVMREMWGRDDAVVFSDCLAVSNMIGTNYANNYAENNIDAAVKAYNGGLDVDMGDSFFVLRSEGSNGGLENAIAQNLVTEERVNL